MYRLYVEDFTCEEVWAIDTGPETAMRRFKNVIVSNIIGVSKTDLLADNKKNPKAWIEYIDAELKIINNTAILR
jgi:hypothetical protein